MHWRRTQAVSGYWTPRTVTVPWHFGNNFYIQLFYHMPHVIYHSKWVNGELNERQRESIMRRDVLQPLWPISSKALPQPQPQVRQTWSEWRKKKYAATHYELNTTRRIECQQISGLLLKACLVMDLHKGQCLRATCVITCWMAIYYVSLGASTAMMMGK